MIKTWSEFHEIQDLCDSAEDKIITGEGEMGQHYMLIHILGKHGILCLSRQDTIPQARKLLDEFVLLQEQA